AGGLTQVVDDDRVERIGGSHREEAAFHAHRAHRVLAKILRRQILEHRQRRRQLVGTHVGQVLLPGERAQHVVGGDGAECDESLTDQLAHRLRARQGALDDVGGGEALLHEDLAQKAGTGHAHAMLRIMLAYLAFAAVAAVADVAGAVLVTTAHKRRQAPLRYFVAAGAGFMLSPTLGGLLFLAVVIHKVPEGFTIASIMLAGGYSSVAAVAAGASLGVLTIAGAVLTGIVADQHVGYALALSAGVTIYVAASDLIPEVNREGGPALAWTVFAGLIFFIVADWLLSAFVTH